MRLYFMKQSAVNYMKANMQSIYTYYYRESTNDWLNEIFDEDPFEFFMEVPDFSLAPYNEKKGVMDIENCKILYQKLRNISESQASDERLWAGLCHKTFYNYVRDRWGYKTRKLTTPDKDAGMIISRFFFSGSIRAGFYRNTLAKYWWVGHSTYQQYAENKFELLDFLGPDDFATKVNDLFYSNTFSSNLNIVKGICKGWKMLSDTGEKLSVRDHFRPALQNMNAIGGAVLLDVLSEEEIKDIFTENVAHFYSRDIPNMLVFDSDYEDDTDDSENFFEDTSEDLITTNEDVGRILSGVTNSVREAEESKENYIGNRSQEDENDAKKIEKLIGKPKEVIYGCKVSVCINNNKILNYIIPKEKNNEGWLPFMDHIIGKQINDEFMAYGKKFVIKDINW